MARAAPRPPLATVAGVACDGTHRFSKTPAPEIRIEAGLGVARDAHAGVTVQHRSRVRIDPTAPNLRQVHLLHAELFDEVAAAGFHVVPADLGENITTRGLDLLALPRGTRLRIGGTVLEITGLRNPCAQIDRFQPGLLAQLVAPGPDGPILKGGVMAIALASGSVRPGDPITIELPPPPHRRLERV